MTSQSGGNSSCGRILVEVSEKDGSREMEVKYWNGENEGIFLGQN